VPPFRLAVERLLDAPADLLYHCLADYQHHHRPGGFLPPAFTDLQVLRGGFGAGTVIRFTTTLLGRSATRTHEVSEPEPGRVLVESGAGEGSTFTVEPRGQRTLVRIDTVLQAPGLEGVLLRLLGPRLLRPLLLDELARLERYARAQPWPPAAATRARQVAEA
jgi:Polyketide cyclase / dehydrase and lipid transport